MFLANHEGLASSLLHVVNQHCTIVYLYTKTRNLVWAVEQVEIDTPPLPPVLLSSALSTVPPYRNSIHFFPPYFQGKLSLQRLWFYVQPSMRTMETLEALTVELRDSKGGDMLRRLKTLGGMGGGGDEASRQLYTFLFQQVPMCARAYGSACVRRCMRV